MRWGAGHRDRRQATDKKHQGGGYEDWVKGKRKKTRELGAGRWINSNYTSGYVFLAETRVSLDDDEHEGDERSSFKAHGATSLALINSHNKTAPPIPHDCTTEKEGHDGCGWWWWFWWLFVVMVTFDFD